MPNANSIAKRYSKLKSAFFVPLGLQHELVTACAVRSFYDFFKDREKPNNMWSVISTGVLQRSMQIALPETNFNAIAVARNIQHGELGKANFFSYHKTFNSQSDLLPLDFDCEKSYDSKGWDYLCRYGVEGDWFFNVAGNAPKPTIDKTSIDSYRDWNDLRDFNF
jgi:hypothetical protein